MSQKTKYRDRGEDRSSRRGTKVDTTSKHSDPDPAPAPNIPEDSDNLPDVNEILRLKISKLHPNEPYNDNVELVEMLWSVFRQVASSRWEKFLNLDYLEIDHCTKAIENNKELRNTVKICIESRNFQPIFQFKGKISRVKKIYALMINST